MLAVENKNAICGLTTRQMAFWGACCAERIINLYNDFANEISKENDPYFEAFANGNSILSKCIDDVFKLISEDKIPTTENATISDLILSTIPDTDEISSTAATLAQCSAISISYLYNFTNTANAESIIYCAEKVIEAIDIIEYSKGATEKEIFEEIKKENAFQLENIQKLIQFSDFSSFSINAARRSNITNQITI